MGADSGSTLTAEPAEAQQDEVAGTQPARTRGRRPGQAPTREEILVAARDLFAEKGYSGATIRAIARAADVDSALVHHYFGTKERVFIAAMQVPVDLTRLIRPLMDGPRADLGRRIVATFLEVGEAPESRAPLLALLRSAMTNEQAAAMLREFVSGPLLSKVADRLGLSPLVINAIAGQLIGMMVFRYVLEIEPMASADVPEVVELVAPAVQALLVPPAR